MNKLIEIFAGFWTGRVRKQKKIMNQAVIAAEVISQFVGKDSNHTYISLGENCSTAWYLKQVGVKQASYPFDWIFSSPDIIVDCINDKFSRFLDKRFILPKQGGESAGHSYYHLHMFNHRNPLKSEGDYAYYQRCCQRFLDVMVGGESTIFIITLINEPEKRFLWADGFTKDFTTLPGQSLNRTKNLIDYICQSHNAAKFIIIDHYTHQQSYIKCKQRDSNTLLLEFYAEEGSNGVYYTDEIDDKAFKMVLSRLK